MRLGSPSSMPLGGVFTRQVSSGHFKIVCKRMRMDKDHGHFLGNSHCREST